GAAATRASRCSVAIVGLLSTAATSGSANSSRILTRRCDHASTSPSCCASSKIARAYRLAAAVATGDLLDRTLDQPSVLGLIQGLADDFLGRSNHKPRDLILGRL